jgi:hypothetical protein
MTSFFRFVKKQAIYLDGKISLAYAWLKLTTQYDFHELFLK